MTGFIRLMFRAVLGVCAAGVVMADRTDGVSTPSSTRLDGLLIPVRQMAQQVEAAEELTLTALENALAAQDEAERELMAALRSGDRDRVSAADKRIHVAGRDTAEVRKMVSEITGLGAECRAAADEAERAIASAAGSESGSDGAETALRRVEKLKRVMSKAVQRIMDMVAVLRDRWLVPEIHPMPTTVNTTTTTTTRPPNPTPVGRR